MHRYKKYLRQQQSFRTGIMIVMFVSSMLSPKSSAAQPTATIVSQTGTVQAIFQSGEVIVATVGLSLQAGDFLETQSGAEVIVEFSDGSQLEISENTKLNLADLLEDADTGARTSFIKLAWGKFRAILSPGHQEEGSAFSVETPNSLVGFKFSQPIVTVAYDPETDTTTIDAETVDVVVTNLRTQRTQLLLRGQRGIVRKDSISLNIGQTPSSSPKEPQQQNQGETLPQPPVSPENQGPLSPQNAPIPSDNPQLPASPSLPRDTRMSPPLEGGLEAGSPQSQTPQSSINRNAFAPAQRGIRAATGSTVPTSVGVVGVRQPGQQGQPEEAGPSSLSGGSPNPGGGGISPIGPLPQPGTRPENPENRQRRTIIIHLREQ